MIILALILMAQSPTAHDLTIVTSITLKMKHLDRRESQSAQQYARCLSKGFFPVTKEFASKRQLCRGVPELKGASKKLQLALKQIDAVVRKNPGSEASLKIVHDDA
jgi:hypothetical protein